MLGHLMAVSLNEHVSLFFAVYLAALSDDEECFEPHDDLPSRQDLSNTPLFVLATNHITLEELQPVRLPRLFTPQTGRPPEKPQR